MLASWISQASFDPPGLTVAVKRDRATESLMVRFVGSISVFSISMSAECQYMLMLVDGDSVRSPWFVTVAADMGSRVPYMS